MVCHVVNHSTNLDAAFHALSNPTRRAVVARLMRGPASVKDLAEPFDMGLPAFMKHLGVLESSGLVRSRKKGRVRLCSVRQDELLAVERWFAEQRQLWSKRYENLDGLLAELQDDDD